MPAVQIALRGAALALLAGCGSSAVEIFEQCTVDVALQSSSGAPGDAVIATGGPFGEPFDNAVQVNGTLARVLSTDRTERLDADGVPRMANACDRCDNCRSRNLGHCNRCKVQCYECVETLTFEVPAAPAGDTDVLVLNAWGGSPRTPFTVLGGGTTATGTGTGSPTGTGTGSPTGTGTGTGAPTGTGTGSSTGTGTGAPTGTGTGAPTGTGSGAPTGTGTGTGATGTGTGTGTGAVTGTGTGVATGTGTGVTTP